MGEGPLQVNLAFERGAMALGGEGRFSQRIFDRAGGYSDHDVGEASFHLTHSHWHYTGLAAFSLHAYDPVTGLRGEEVSAHHKAGFCFLDVGEIEDDEIEPAQTEFAETNCLVPDETGWSMGVSVGWYDLYTSGLTDQYVEVSDVADGVYELVSLADGLGTLDEVDETNNAASVIVELQGDNANVLGTRGYYHLSR